MPVSEKQLEANKENAKKGGVKTEEGKQKSSQNAIKHGLLAQKTVLDDENKQEYQKLKLKVFEDFDPEDVIEKLYAELIASDMWRLRRALGLEKHAMSPTSGGEIIEGTGMVMNTKPKRTPVVVENDEPDSYDNAMNFILHDNSQTIQRYITKLENRIETNIEKLEKRKE